MQPANDDLTGLEGSPAEGPRAGAELRAVLSFLEPAEVSGREHRELRAAEAAQLQALVEGHLDARDRPRLMSFIAENGVALQCLAELLLERERAGAGG